jgi:hypothetical protein
MQIRIERAGRGAFSFYMNIVTDPLPGSGTPSCFSHCEPFVLDSGDSARSSSGRGKFTAEAAEERGADGENHPQISRITQIGKRIGDLAFSSPKKSCSSYLRSSAFICDYE